MEIHLQVGRRHLVVSAALAAAVLGGVAYAAIPSGGGVYTACTLNSNGSVRLIDPSLSSGPLSRCTANETQVQWNEQGQPGANGKDGVSPTVAPLTAGDAHCQTGGASITDAAGTVAYVCNGAAGQPGRDGAPFSGTFRSPNGQFTLTVADGGVSIIGPDSSIELPASGGVEIQANDLTAQVAHDLTTVVGHNRSDTVGANATVAIGHDRSQQIGNDDTTHVGHDRTQTVDRNESIVISGDRIETVHQGETIHVDRSRTTAIGLNDSLSVSANRSEQVGGGLQVQSGGAASILGAHLALGSASCSPAARVGDSVGAAAILTGSATVCIGG